MIMKSDETKKVLIVVDDPQTRQWLTDWFQDNGFDPLEIKDVDSVNTQICEKTQLVISDIHAAGSDTARLIQIVRSAAANPPIILLTASDSIDSAVQCLKNGATDFVLKPVGAAELSVKVERALKERQLHQELAMLRAAKSSNPIVGEMANVQQEVKTLQRIEREAILEALDGFGGARGKTAKALGISVRTLQRKIKEYGYTNGGEKPASSFSGVNQRNALHN